MLTGHLQCTSTHLSPLARSQRVCLKFGDSWGFLTGRSLCYSITLTTDSIGTRSVWATYIWNLQSLGSFHLTFHDKPHAMTGILAQRSTRHLLLTVNLPCWDSFPTALLLTSKGSDRTPFWSLGHEIKGLSLIVTSWPLLINHCTMALLVAFYTFKFVVWTNIQTVLFTSIPECLLPNECSISKQ